MVHCAQMVAVLKVNGQVMREIRENGTDTIYLPFGSEYEIEFQNLSSKRAAVTVEVDEQSATGGNQIVIDANSRGSLKGFMDSNGNVAHNRFKFIKMTDKIEEHKGIGARDGLIRIEWQYEKPYIPPYIPPYIYDHRKSVRWPNEPGKIGTSGISYGGSVLRGADAQFSCSTNDCDAPTKSINSMNDSWKNSDKGITVEGSVVDQKFGTTYLRELEAEKHVVVFELRGRTSEGGTVSVARTVKTRVSCQTCGKSNKSHDKFCAECGSCLI